MCLYCHTVSSLSALALHLPIENLLIPSSAYFTDRKKLPDIYAPFASGKRAFGVTNPFPVSASGPPRLPRVLREATRFILTDPLIQTEGLFRVSARQQTVEVLREAYDRGQKFIIWREGSVLQTTSHHKEGSGDVSISTSDLEQADGYDVHIAAAIIKLWYKELKEPVFPQTSYQALGKYYGSPDTTFDFPTLRQMLDPGVEYTVLSPISRQILTTHLLPLLSDVSLHSDLNKMTPSNLAVCFAPILLRGPDPLEDVKMTAIIRQILTAMIETWSEELAPALGLTNEKLEASLQLPSSIEDREDPLDEAHPKSKTLGMEYGAMESQVSGIALLDNDNDASSSSEVPIEADDDSDNDTIDEFRPPLPPRPITHAATDPSPFSAPLNSVRNVSGGGGGGSIMRKPAPVLQTPPRYSTIIPTLPPLTGFQRRDQGPTGTVEGLIESGGLAMHRESVATLPPYEEMQGAGRRETEVAGAGLDGREAIGGGGGGAREGDTPTTAGTGEERSLNSASATSIPRKPVGEGKGGAKWEGEGEAKG